MWDTWACTYSRSKQNTSRKKKKKKTYYRFFKKIYSNPHVRINNTLIMPEGCVEIDLELCLSSSEDQKENVASMTKRKIRPLTASQNADINDFTRCRRNTNVVISSLFSISITIRDIQTLVHKSWLNDNIIDFYLNLLMDQYQNVFCFNTHFYPALIKGGYQRVSLWAQKQKVDIFEKDFIIIPLNVTGTHWSLGVIDNKAKLICHYDSNSRNYRVPTKLNLLNDYLVAESERLLRPVVTYTLQLKTEMPQQGKSGDCGVFACAMARCVCEGSIPNFCQKDMRILRHRMAYEIINQRLLGN